MRRGKVKVNITRLEELFCICSTINLMLNYYLIKPYLNRINCTVAASQIDNVLQK